MCLLSWGVIGAEFLWAPPDGPTQSYLATCNWGRSEATEHWPLVSVFCMEEGNHSGELKVCGRHGSARKEYAIRRRRCRFCHQLVLKTFTAPHLLFNHQWPREGMSLLSRQLSNITRCHNKKTVNILIHIPSLLSNMWFWNLNCRCPCWVRWRSSFRWRSDAQADYQWCSAAGSHRPKPCVCHWACYCRMYHVATERTRYQHSTATWPQRQAARVPHSQKCRWFPEIYECSRQGTGTLSAAVDYWWRWGILHKSKYNF